MVRRILPDSDTESDDENSRTVSAKAPELTNSSKQALTSDVPGPTTPVRTSPTQAPQSRRRVVRHRDTHPEPVATYEYDSDIYTEESSMGSFIVRTDSESEDETNEKALSTSESEDVSVSCASPESHSEHVPVAQKLDSPPPDNFLSEALLVHNPQPSARKQTSLSKDIPTSPKRFKYPLSPHKESSSQFWDKQDHYTWIDQNTPHEPPPQKLFPTTTPAQINKAKKDFLQAREQIAIDLVRAIDEQVMGGKLSASTSTTGGVKLEWSTRLRTAAGRAHWSRAKSGSQGQTQEQHSLKIELSTKVITNEGKLRDTLAHELCHCALWVIDQDPKSHHGKQFKEWGTKISQRFPDILVTTKHTYEIEYKYTYTCTNPLCGLDFGRQRKLDLTRLACGACKSRLEQTKPVLKVGKENKVNPFGIFIKEKFAVVKKENPGMKHKEIMRILSNMYREEKEGGEDGDKEVEYIVIEESEDEIGDVATALEDLDLQ